jgi:hypothetical protein
MVSLGFVPSDKTIPVPDMSFARLFSDESAGWQHRGQFAIWTGRSSDASHAYRLLERIGDRVVAIAHEDGRPVFHKIARGTPFTVEGLTDYWLSIDSDAMWLDTPRPGGRYAVLTIGGSEGKPSRAVLDWSCPNCGESISPKTIEIPPMGVKVLLRKAEAAVDEFNANPQLRTCASCACVHPPVSLPTPGEAEPTQRRGI